MLLRIMTKFRPIVLSGPSGTGKSTLVKRLMGEYPGCFAFSVSHTTRAPRPGEEDGKDYHFVDREFMQKGIANNEFVEFAEFSGNMYGTSKAAVEEVAHTGAICILDVDVQGVKNLKKTDLNPRYIFVKPPSMEALEERLRHRGTESEEGIKKRLDASKAEFDFAKEPNSYDHIILNDDLDTAYKKLKCILEGDLDEIKATKGSLLCSA